MGDCILVTGGAGFIGSHACLELLNNGDEVIVIDNLDNSSEESLARVQEITKKEITFYKEDLINADAIDSIFSKHKINAVIHFAGLKAVGESNTIPLHYYHNNITGTLVLLNVMKKHKVFNLVFSSSATVYGAAETVPITEDAPLSATNPYGQTKLMIEIMMRDLAKAESEWNIALLRYFNPIGAHESGKIGEDPNGIPNNLVPYISQVAVGKLKELSVFGDDYDTHDGTGVRDYIHVVDLVLGHIKALEKLKTNPGLVTYNLGTGNGCSVLDIIKAFEKASDIKIPYKVAPRREGDAAKCYSDASLAKEELGWVAERDIEIMCEDVWRWQKNNPSGYKA